MDPVMLKVDARPPARARITDPRMRAFRATDAFVVEAYRVASAMDGPRGRELGREIRRIVARCGGALVAASVAVPGRAGERRCLESARMRLAEGRYYLYLARRFGLLDLTRYRTLASRQDAAAREMDAAFGPTNGRAPGARDPT